MKTLWIFCIFVFFAYPFNLKAQDTCSKVDTLSQNQIESLKSDQGIWDVLYNFFCPYGIDWGGPYESKGKKYAPHDPNQKQDYYNGRTGYRGFKEVAPKTNNDNRSAGDIFFTDLSLKYLKQMLSKCDLQSLEPKLGLLNQNDLLELMSEISGLEKLSLEIQCQSLLSYLEDVE